MWTLEIQIGKKISRKKKSDFFFEMIGCPALQWGFQVSSLLFRLSLDNTIYLSTMFIYTTNDQNVN
jgi:hypothetical protein